MKRRNRETNIFSMSALDLFASALGAFILLFLILLPYYLKTSHELMAENKQLQQQNQQLQADLSECRTELEALRPQVEALTAQLAECKQQQQGLDQRIAELERQLAQAQEQLEQTQAQLQQCQQQQAQTQNQLRECQQQQQSQQAQIAELETERDQLQRQNRELNEAVRDAQGKIAEYKQKLSQTFLAVVMKWPTVGDDIDLHVVDPQGNEFYFSRNNRNRRDVPGSRAELSVDTTKGPGIEIWEQPSAKPGDYKIYYHFYADRVNQGAVTVQGAVYYRDGSHKLPDRQLNRHGDKPLVATITVNADGDVSVR